jgi:DNA-binding CsgD family transcriptional regulator
MVGMLANGEHSVEELANRLELTPPTVSHHLNRLKEIGLVRMEARGTTHLYRLAPEALHAMSKEVLSPERVAALVESEEQRKRASAGESDDAFDQRVLRDFFDGERLREIPAQRKKRWVILRWLAARFDLDQRYTEREVNEIIKRHHEDASTLRRELVGGGLMQRESGVYWRTAAEPDTSGRKWEY